MGERRESHGLVKLTSVLIFDAAVGFAIELGPHLIEQFVQTRVRRRRRAAHHAAMRAVHVCGRGGELSDGCRVEVRDGAMGGRHSRKPQGKGWNKNGLRRRMDSMRMEMEKAMSGGRPEKLRGSRVRTGAELESCRRAEQAALNREGRRRSRPAVATTTPAGQPQRGAGETTNRAGWILRRWQASGASMEMDQQAGGEGLVCMGQVWEKEERKESV